MEVDRGQRPMSSVAGLRRPSRRASMTPSLWLDRKVCKTCPCSYRQGGMGLSNDTWAEIVGLIISRTLFSVLLTPTCRNIRFF